MTEKAWIRVAVNVSGTCIMYDTLAHRAIGHTSGAGLMPFDDKLNG